MNVFGLKAKLLVVRINEISISLKNGSNGWLSQV